MSNKVIIIILNWNGWQDTIKCLESINRNNYSKYNVIVVDNASHDESVIQIEEYIQKVKNIKKSAADITLIKNNKNYGFAGGNNIGIRRVINSTNSKYILLLNNDTTVDKNFLDELVKLAEADETIGSVQSVLLKPGGTIIDSIGQELTTWSARDIEMGSKYEEFNDNREIFGACAASALYRRSVLEDVGLFDEDFFVMYEDVDLSWRIRLSGYKSLLAANSIVYHHRNVSKSVFEIQIFDWLKNDLKLYHLTKNMLILAIRYHSSSFLLNPEYLLKLFLTFSLCSYYSLRARRVHKTFKILKKNLKCRKSFQTNPRLSKLQKRWIRGKDLIIE